MEKLTESRGIREAENLVRQTSMSHSELMRRRQQESESAWGGVGLSEAISSSPFQRDIPANLNQNPHRNLVRDGSSAISVPTGSSIDQQMDTMNQPVRLAENLYQNYDLIGEENALEDEYEQYLKEAEDAKDPHDEEEDKDVDYWNQMYNASNNRNTRTDRPIPQAMNHRIMGQHRSQPVHDSQDSRPINMNPHGQYDLNFIDWDNEWERAYDAMEADGK
jgi:hypothetical protein